MAPRPPRGRGVSLLRAAFLFGYRPKLWLRSPPESFIVTGGLDPDSNKAMCEEFTPIAEFLETVHDSGLLSFLDEVEGLTAGSNPRELATQLRQHSAKIIELFDDHIAMHCEAIDMETANCPGPLRMRATAHKRIVTLTVCNSPAVLDGSSKNEPVHIQRDRVM